MMRGMGLRSGLRHLWRMQRRAASSVAGFDKILVANRGEIACRVIDTAKRLGVRTVAVYSEADANAQHALRADEAYCIGAAPSSESYLLGERIVEVAKKTGAQAVHPGYGFLSENWDFAGLCESHGITFIGPPASAMIDMASKSRSKEIMEEAGVPVVPGYYGDNQDPAFLKSQADEMGYPVLIKAVMGGGGKGMRTVMNEAEFDEALRAVKAEAQASFGNDVVLVEKYLTVPRHIELQVFADKHGNCVHMFERDCSVQRRHQKVLEEAPAPFMTPEWRRAMGDAAVAAAKAVDYVGAGTVEFIVDTLDNSYYFMEMNTRLQVEHPVTEMVTGQDLVALQLSVAAGNPLPFTQEDLGVTGHAIEARIYAEDPFNEFLPDTGNLKYLRPPSPSKHVRVDTGVQSGDDISVFYDPMISKLIVWDKDRPAALARLTQALNDYHVVGLKTNIEFCKRIVNHPKFADASGLETGFIGHHMDALVADTAPPPHEAVVLATASMLWKEHRATVAQTASDHAAWAADGWRGGAPLTREMTLVAATTGAGEEGAGSWEVAVSYESDGLAVSVDGEAPVLVQGALEGEDKNTVHARVGDHHMEGKAVTEGDALHLFVRGQHYTFEVPRPAFLASSGDHSAAGSLSAPMPGKIVQVLVREGEEVAADQPLVIMEAMKMEHTIRAPEAGVVASVGYEVGEIVEKDAALVVVEGADDE